MPLALYPSTVLYPSEALYPSDAEEPTVTPESNPPRTNWIPPKTPHLAYPFHVASGIVATVQQDSTREVAQNVFAALSTRIGSRVDAPEYGTPSELFSQLTLEPSVDAVLAVVEEWEPRASLLSEVEIEDLVERVLVKVGVVA